MRPRRLPACLYPSCRAVHGEPCGASGFCVLICRDLGQQGLSGLGEDSEGPTPWSQDPGLCCWNCGLWYPRVPGPQQLHMGPCRDKRHLQVPTSLQTWRSRLSLPPLACHAFGGQHLVTQTIGWEPRAVPFHVPHGEVRAGWPE